MKEDVFRSNDKDPYPKYSTHYSKPHTPAKPESLPSSPSGTEMKNVQDFVTSFLSEDATAPQEPAANLSKVDTQYDVQHVAVTQEPTTNSIGVTQEPVTEELKIDDLEVLAPQEPTNDSTLVEEQKIDYLEVANPQEPTTHSTCSEEKKLDDQEVAIPQEPTTNPVGVTQESHADDHDLETHQDIAATDSAGFTQEPPADK